MSVNKEIKMQLRIPGPTPCPPEALEAMAKQMINHRGEEFGKILTSLTEKLKQVFQTKGDILLLTVSGTGGLEAAIVNTLSPGDRCWLLPLESLATALLILLSNTGLK